MSATQTLLYIVSFQENFSLNQEKNLFQKLALCGKNVVRLSCFIYLLEKKFSGRRKLQNCLKFS